MFCKMFTLNLFMCVNNKQCTGKQCWLVHWLQHRHKLFDFSAKGSTMKHTVIQASDTHTLTALDWTGLLSLVWWWSQNGMSDTETSWINTFRAGLLTGCLNSEVMVKLSDSLPWFSVASLWTTVWTSRGRFRPKQTASLWGGFLYLW